MQNCILFSKNYKWEQCWISNDGQYIVRFGDLTDLVTLFCATHMHLNIICKTSKHQVWVPILWN